jgi:hypothetical protein
LNEPTRPADSVAPRLPDAYSSFEDAVGVTGDLTEVEFIGEIENPGIRQHDYTEKWVGRGPDGVWYPAHYNPKTDTWRFGKSSSRNN